MYAGIISDIDPQGCYGLIESDDGEIVLFSRKSLRPDSEPQALRIGQRVQFMIDAADPAPRANWLTPERHHH
jgi:cold shock CspA family protein